MPYPNEHAARQEDPSKYTKFRRKNNAGGDGIDFIYGITSDNKTEIQSIRARASKYTVAEFRSWLKKHNFKTNVEPATGKSLDEIELQLNKILNLLNEISNL